jgi:hypothetical protein
LRFDVDDTGLAFTIFPSLASNRKRFLRFWLRRSPRMSLNASYFGVRYGSGDLTSHPILQPFAFRALQHRNGTGRIIDAVCNAMVVAKIELRQVTVKVLAAYVVIGAYDPAFQDRKEPFNGIGMRIATDVLTRAMVNHGLRDSRNG